MTATVACRLAALAPPTAAAELKVWNCDLLTEGEVSWNLDAKQ